jgi:conjugal transfer/type IV secretion protein DotA/TraY
VVVPPTDLSNLPYPQLYQSVMASYQLQLQQDASTSTGVSTMDTSNNLFAGNVTQDMDVNILAQLFPGADLVGQIKEVMVSATQPTNGSPLNPLIVMKSVGDKIIHETVEYLNHYLGRDSRRADKAPAKPGAGTSSGSAAQNGAVSDSIEPFVVAIAVTLLFFGVMLSVYMPMLPFIVWFGGVVSWFMVVAEAMVASPLWAMTHLDGDGEGLGHRTQHGYVFLLNVMFRPVVMVFGFLLAGASVIVLGSLLNTMFGIAVQNTQYGSTAGLAGLIGFVVLYVGMCQTLCNSAFSLVHTLPDNLFSWIGGQLASAHTGFGEGVKQGFESHLNQGSADGHSLGHAPKGGPGPRTSSSGMGGVHPR